MSLTQQAKEEVERLLREGGKIAAIKHMKDQYGFSLDQSKILVEAMEGNVKADSPLLHTRKRTLDESDAARLSDLLRSGKKIEAIKLVKDALGVRLKDARDMVEKYERLINRERSSAPAARGPGVIIGLVFGGVGLILTAIAVYILLNQYTSIRSSDLITGRVIRLATNADGAASPVIEYEWAGKKWLHASTTYSSPPAYEVNEEVPVYVNREDPTTIIVDTFMGRWFLLTILGSMGLIFGGIGIVGGGSGCRRPATALNNRILE